MTMADAVDFPTLAQIRGWMAEHLDTAADAWTTRARIWENSYTAVLHGVSAPGGTSWHGAAADAAARRISADRRVVLGAADLLNDAAAVARTGAGEIRAARQVAIGRITTAQAAGFDVEDDLSISDRTSPTRAMRAHREAEAAAHARGVWNAADTLIATDTEVARRIRSAVTVLKDLRFASTSGPELPDTLLAEYGGLLPRLPAAPHLIYCYPSARPDFWWCEGYGLGTGPYGFDSPWDLSGVA